MFLIFLGINLSNLELKDILIALFLIMIMFSIFGRGFIRKYTTSDIKKLSISTTTKFSSPYKTIMPLYPHVTLYPNDLKEKLVIIGDIHGCFDELKELLDACHYKSSTTTVIFVGDLVNKGPYSAEVVKFVKSMCDHKYAYCVRGNHDDYALAIALNLLQSSRNGLDYLNQLSSDEIDWLNNMPYTISIPHLNILVVHAGLVPGIPLEKQSAGDMHSMRNIEEKQENGEGNGRKVLIASSKDKIGKPWIEYWKQNPHIYFGHDAKRGLQQTEYATGLDTGCVYGKKLTAIILPSKEIVSIRAKKVYEEVKNKGGD